ncbi:pentatricopeptide repeat-containing protein [Pyrus ussuriensis x Pyrus communis]|uniref:Pentatricopeptide repeat-containing protein n=1 Tax=Pyrus ussuriensis x Pyrus communis TaxID=2448454 RepID=A0A5N5H530_9ROSA|nr:pentatricopeptide repeat-containing protein [Pyrus ussuriensis x Pyrus communis]
MSRRWLKTLLWQSISAISPSPLKSSPFFSTNPSQPFPSPFKSSHQSLKLCFPRLLCTSWQDNLDGLFDPNYLFKPESSGVESISAEEFASLRDSVLDTSAGGGSSIPKFESAKFSNNAILISNAIRNNNDEDNLNETLVVEVLKLIQNPELGVKFFICAGKQIGYSHTAPVYDALLELLECGNKRVEEHFLQEIKGDDREVLRKLLNVLIRKYCQNGLWNVALEELGRLKDIGYKPTQATYNALVLVVLEADKLDTAHLVHVEMLDSGFKMDEYTFGSFGSFVHTLCKAGRWKEALALVEKEEFVPNTILYTNMISGLCEASHFEEAKDFLNRMRYGFCKYGKLDEAQEVFAKMSEQGYSPNVYTYSSLIDRLFKDKRLDLASKVLSKMLEHSCAPNVVIYTEMIDALCKVGKTDEAYKLMLMMEEKGCYPNVVTYTAMIDGFGKAGNIEKCVELFKQMSSEGCAPNFISYGVLINHCCSTGLLDEAHKLLDEMKQTHWPKHMVGYCNVIEGYNREFMTSLGLLNEMSEFLIDNFVKAGMLEVALELLKEISSSSPFTSVNKNMYTSLIESLSHANKVGKALEMFADMMRHGGFPELDTFFHLIKGLIKANNWDEALQLQIAYATWISIGICKKRHLTEISVFSRPSLFVTHAPSDDSLDLVTWLTVLLRSGVHFYQSPCASICNMRM